MKRIILSTLAIIAITLTACSSFSTSTLTNSTQADNTSPTELQLAVGIVKLEGTENEITAEQAPELLMLWQVYQELGQSDTAAQEEVDALIDQIQETMTIDQIQAITEMQITQQDIAVAMQGSGITTSSSSDSSSITVPSSGMPAGGPQDGGTPPDMAGGIPADFGGTGGSATSNGQTQNAQTGSGVGGGASVPSGLVEALIQILEQKIAA